MKLIVVAWFCIFLHPRGGWTTEEYSVVITKEANKTMQKMAPAPHLSRQSNLKCPPLSADLYILFCSHTSPTGTCMLTFQKRTFLSLGRKKYYFTVWLPGYSQSGLSRLCISQNKCRLHCLCSQVACRELSSGSGLKGHSKDQYVVKQWSPKISGNIILPKSKWICCFIFHCGHGFVTYFRTCWSICLTI